MAPSIFTELHIYHHYLASGHLITPEWNLLTTNHHFSFSSSPSRWQLVRCVVSGFAPSPPPHPRLFWEHLVELESSSKWPFMFVFFLCRRTWSSFIEVVACFRTSSLLTGKWYFMMGSRRPCFHFLAIMDYTVANICAQIFVLSTLLCVYVSRNRTKFVSWWLCFEELPNCLPGCRVTFSAVWGFQFPESLLTIFSPVFFKILDILVVVKCILLYFCLLLL